MAVKCMPSFTRPCQPSVRSPCTWEANSTTFLRDSEAHRIRRSYVNHFRNRTLLIWIFIHRWRIHVLRNLYTWTVPPTSLIPSAARILVYQIGYRVDAKWLRAEWLGHWKSGLREHLTDKTSVRLTVDCIWRFRSVCKQWNGLHSSNNGSWALKWPLWFPPKSH